MHFLQLDLHILAHLQVEGRQRFVEQQHARLVDQGAGDGHTLLLATGERLHVAVFVVRHAHELKHFLHALLDLFFRHFVEFQAKGHVVIDVEMRKERIALEYGIQFTQIWRYVVDDLAFHRHGSFVGLGEAGDQAQRRGLAATRRAEQRHELATLHAERDVVEHLPFTERLGDVVQPDDDVVVFSHSGSA